MGFFESYISPNTIKRDIEELPSYPILGRVEGFTKLVTYRIFKVSL